MADPKPPVYNRGVIFRALAVGALAIGSKAAMFVKAAGGTGSLAKGVGLLVGGGAAASAMYKTTK